MHHTPTTPDRLHDSALEGLLRDVIAEAKRRPAMSPALRQILAGELDEIKAEALHAKAPAARTDTGFAQRPQVVHPQLGHPETAA